jgi:hypothetical protein
MHSHVVVYKTYPDNLDAADRIIRAAHSLLANIPGARFFHAGKILDLGRVVGGGSEYHVMLTIIFSRTEWYRSYMRDPNHLEFAGIVLNGYMLVGSQSDDLQAEFISHILSGGHSRQWIRNPAIPDSEVVWSGETTFDAI